VNKKLLALYGLKWNPFAPDVPTEALQVTPRIESFCWRVEQLAGEGGFALITGAPGVGKSATLRLLAERLASMRDVQVGVLSRPQAALADFYRELGVSSLVWNCIHTIVGVAPRSFASAGRATSMHP
jgi:general secretion pathway protein A